MTLGSTVGLSIGVQHKGRWLILLVFYIIAIAFGPVGPYVYMDKHHYTVIWLRQDPFYVISWRFNY